MTYTRAWERASFWLLATLLVLLPTIEVPKTIAALLFIVVSWLGPSSRNAGRRPDAFGWALLGVVAASLASTAVNWPFPSGARGLYDTVLYAAVGWGVYRRTWTHDQVRGLAAAGVVGALAGLMRGVFDVPRGLVSDLELHTMTSPTSSAIYLGIILIVAASLAALDSRSKPWWWAAACVLLVGLLLMGSRGGTLAVALAGGGWLLVVRPPRIWIPVAAVAIGIVVATALPNTFHQERAFAKISEMIATRHLDDNDSLRVTIWKFGIAQVVRGDSLWLGVGPRNFSTLDPSRVGIDIPIVAAGLRLGHAHNMFLTKTVEEGVIGLAALLALLGAVVHRVARDWIAGRARDWRWGAGWGALVVPVVAGSFNTPWNQEHALLAMIWFGVYLGWSVRDLRINGEHRGPKAQREAVDQASPESRVLTDVPT